MSVHLHRREIDGLRSIAVLAVVLYHFGLPGLKGGFVGVDIFFVISGFLIGGILWAELVDTGRISLRRFYTRRIKRLAPAYLAMGLATFVVGWFVLLPFEFRELGKQLIAATVYLSNVLFWRQAGYFDAAAEEKPLLHTWSLAVEEQFYIVLPIIMIVLLRYPRVLLGVLVATFGLSLAATIALTPTQQTSTFFLFPFRAWELLAGVLLAIWGRGWTWQVGAWASYLGLALVLAGIVFIGAEGFPGWQATIPVTGTVLLILNGRHANPVNQVLSHPVPVFIGLISYSLYLWHWPILVLSTYWRGGYSGPLEIAVWLAVCFVVAVFSWRVIEQPVRRAQWMGFSQTMVGGALASLILIGIGGWLFVKDGLSERFPPETQRYIAATQDFLQDFSRCEWETEGPLTGLEVCPIGPEGTPEVLIWGDSHVRALFEGLNEAAFETETPAIVVWTAGCPPLFGVEKVESAATPEENVACGGINRAMEAAIPKLDLDRIILVGRWGYYANGGGVGLDAENTIDLSFAAPDQAGDPFATLLEQTVTSLNAAADDVRVMGAIPEVADFDARSFARDLAHGRMTAEEASQGAQIARDDWDLRRAAVDAAFEAAGVRPVDPFSVLLCTGIECTAEVQGQPIYFDNNHLTNTGARLFVPHLRLLFAELSP